MVKGFIYQETVTMLVKECITCGITFGIPSNLYEQIKKDDKKWFYCPNGHSAHICKTTEQIQKEEYEQKLQEKIRQLQDADIVKRDLQTKLDEANNKLFRVHNGVCPCCKRNFKNLKRHIENKHPHLIKKQG